MSSNPRGFVIERIFSPDKEKQLNALKVLLEYKPVEENECKKKPA